MYKKNPGVSLGGGGQIFLCSAPALYMPLWNFPSFEVSVSSSSAVAPPSGTLRISGRWNAAPWTSVRDNGASAGSAITAEVMVAHARNAAITEFAYDIRDFLGQSFQRVNSVPHNGRTLRLAALTSRTTEQETTPCLHHSPPKVTSDPQLPVASGGFREACFRSSASQLLRAHP